MLCGTAKCCEGNSSHRSSSWAGRTGLSNAALLALSRHTHMWTSTISIQSMEFQTAKQQVYPSWLTAVDFVIHGLLKFNQHFNKCKEAQTIFAKMHVHIFSYNFRKSLFDLSVSGKNQYLETTFGWKSSIFTRFSSHKGILKKHQPVI